MKKSIDPKQELAEIEHVEHEILVLHAMLRARKLRLLRASGWKVVLEKRRAYRELRGYFDVPIERYVDPDGKRKRYLFEAFELCRRRTRKVCGSTCPRGAKAGRK